MTGMALHFGASNAKRHCYSRARNWFTSVSRGARIHSWMNGRVCAASSSGTTRDIATCTNWRFVNGESERNRRWSDQPTTIRTPGKKSSLNWLRRWCRSSRSKCRVFLAPHDCGQQCQLSIPAISPHQQDSKRSCTKPLPFKTFSFRSWRFVPRRICTTQWHGTVDPRREHGRRCRRNRATPEPRRMTRLKGRRGLSAVAVTRRVSAPAGRWLPAGGPPGRPGSGSIAPVHCPVAEPAPRDLGRDQQLAEILLVAAGLSDRTPDEFVMLGCDLKVVTQKFLPRRPAAAVSLDIRTSARATARRSVTSLAPTSTIRALPRLVEVRQFAHAGA